MLYIEDIEALRFWLSPARAVLGGRRFERLSALDGCPKSSRESACYLLEGLHREFERPTLAIPGKEFRAQRNRFDYHVWPRPIPPGSFWEINDEIAIASPTLALVQCARRLRTEHLAQAICSLAGSYIAVPGAHGGMIDELQPLITIDELREMSRQLVGLYSPRCLLPALECAAENSASPQETNLLILCTTSRGKGGLSARCWEMNVEMEVPIELRKYLRQPTIAPDLFSREHELILEYDSNEHHNDLAQMQKDAKRRVVFEAMGYHVIPVYAHNMRSAAQFEPIARAVRSKLGRDRVAANERQLLAREGLIWSLRNNPLLV